MKKETDENKYIREVFSVASAAVKWILSIPIQLISAYLFLIEMVLKLFQLKSFARETNILENEIEESMINWILDDESPFRKNLLEKSFEDEKWTERPPRKNPNRKHRKGKKHGAKNASVAPYNPTKRKPNTSQKKTSSEKTTDNISEKTSKENLSEQNLSKKN